VRVTYNSQGWRDEEHGFENNSGAFRILVLGDSFMEAYSVELKDTFHKQLERFALENGVPIEVINLGVGGYGTLQEYLVFDEIGKRYKPDIVLLGFFLTNDVTDNSLAIDTMITKDSERVKSRPYLDSSETTWKITQVDYEGARRRFLANIAKRDAAFHRLSGQPALLQFIVHAVNRIKTTLAENRKNSENNEDLGDIVENKKVRSFVWYGVNYCQEPPEYTEAWSVTERILKRLKNDVSSIGGKLFVFTVPGLLEVVPERLKKISKRRVPKPELICLEEVPGYNRLAGILNELEIDYVDLLPSFRNNRTNDGRSLFRLSDEHWNEKGHNLAATIVYSSLIEKGLFPLARKN